MSKPQFNLNYHGNVYQWAVHRDAPSGADVDWWCRIALDSHRRVRQQHRTGDTGPWAGRLCRDQSAPKPRLGLPLPWGSSSERAPWSPADSTWWTTFHPRPDSNNPLPRLAPASSQQQTVGSKFCEWFTFVSLDKTLWARKFENSNDFCFFYICLLQITPWNNRGGSITYKRHSECFWNFYF